MKNKITLLPVIMAGGSGSRLWPLSRNDYPKQFLRLCSPITMLQETINRLEGLDCEDPIIICNQKHKYIVKEQLLSFKIKHSAILLEPVGRNTAPAIGLAAFEAMGQKGDVLLLVLSADHLIKNIECFHKAVNKSLKFALDNYLVTFGVTPTRAETCYGYIRKGALIDRSAYQISSFVEKPDPDKAESFFKSDDYLWNSGMFLFKASCYLRELKRYRPDIYHSCMFAINNKNIDGDFINIAHEIFIQCPSESIDYAVMEKTDNAVVMPLASEWSDVGNFPSLWENSIKDCNNNYVDSNVFTSDVYDSYIVTDKKIVAALGFNNMIIVNTADALLVAHKDHCVKIKELITEFERLGRKELFYNKVKFDSWGRKEVINDDVYNINKYIINAGMKLSDVTKEKSKYWVVIHGEGVVELNGSIKKLRRSDSMRIDRYSKFVVQSIQTSNFEFLEIEI